MLIVVGPVESELHLLAVTLKGRRGSRRSWTVSMI